MVVWGLLCLRLAVFVELSCVVKGLGWGFVALLWRWSWGVLKQASRSWLWCLKRRGECCWLSLETLEGSRRVGRVR